MYRVHHVKLVGLLLIECMENIVETVQRIVRQILYKKTVKPCRGMTVHEAGLKREKNMMKFYKEATAPRYGNAMAIKKN